MILVFLFCLANIKSRLSSSPAWVCLSAGSFFNSFTLSAYLRVFKVGSQHERAGDTLAIIVVLLLPMKESLRTYVSLLPLNGRWFFFPAWSRARMHSFNASKLLLISAPSCLVCFPVSMTSAPRSLPAKSMKLILLNCLPPCLTWKVRIAWERDDSSFAPVWPLVRYFKPRWIVSMMSST